MRKIQAAHNHSIKAEAEMRKNQRRKKKSQGEKLNRRDNRCAETVKNSKIKVREAYVQMTKDKKSLNKLKI